MIHFTETFERDEDGWWQVECHCGWKEGPFPGADDAADAFGDHRYIIGLHEAMP